MVLMLPQSSPMIGTIFLAFDIAEVDLYVDLQYWAKAFSQEQICTPVAVLSNESRISTKDSPACL